MKKRRLIPILFLRNGLIVRSESFSEYNIIGNVINEAERYNQWNVDELIYIDISKEKKYDLRRDDHYVASLDSIDKIIDAVSRICFMPLAFGGGIKTYEDAEMLIRRGADKITVNTVAYTDPSVIYDIRKKFGRQCIVMSLDYKMINGKPMFFTHSGKNNTGLTVYDILKHCDEIGVGEILLHSIDRDGEAVGYDIDTITDVCNATNLPVIACGGAGSQDDVLEVFSSTDVDAVAAGNIFHFTERAYPRIKKYLKNGGYNVR